MLFVLISVIFCRSAIKQSYSVFYGSQKAHYKLVNYFDIGCSHCLDFYRDIFPIIKRNFCDTGKLLFIFKPYPIHEETLRYMSCCTILNRAQKRTLFETLMAMDTPLTENIICKCMKAFKLSCPTPTSRVIQDALHLTQQRNFESLPVMFFTKERLTDAEQDHIVQFLEKNLNVD